MSEQQEKGTNWVAVITMMFIYGMISFVTNLAAPMGKVWLLQKGIDGSTTLGMMGNMMNFAAYLFMGIPAGKMLAKKGYKFTAMAGIATGFIGVLIQFLSGKILVNVVSVDECSRGFGHVIRYSRILFLECADYAVGAYQADDDSEHQQQRHNGPCDVD